jgi:hypothetical protein
MQVTGRYIGFVDVGKFWQTNFSLDNLYKLTNPFSRN